MEKLHLMVNHFPIILILVGAVAEVVGWATKKEFPRRMGGVLLLLGALGAIAAFFTGKVAEEIVEEMAAVSHDAVEAHEEWGLIATVVVVVAVAYRFAIRERLDGALGNLSLVLTVVAALVVGWAGFLGGEIMHGPEGPAAPTPEASSQRGPGPEAPRVEAPGAEAARAEGPGAEPPPTKALGEGAESGG